MARVFVGNVPSNATSDDVYQLFSNYSSVWEVFMEDGCYNVLFSDSQEAEDAILTMNGRELYGQKVVVQKESPPTSSTQKEYPQSSQVSVVGSFLSMLKLTKPEFLQNQNSPGMDFEVKVGETIFKTSKSLLAARSEVFAAMLDANMSEAQTNTMEINDTSADAVEQMLKFIHRHSFSLKNFEIAKELYGAADKYMIHELKEKCEDYLVKKLTPETIDECFALADKYNSPEFAERCASSAALDVNENTWKNYLEIAEKFNLPELSKNCVHFAVSTVDMDTVVEYFGVAVKYGIPRLRDKCCEFASTVLCFDTAMDRFFSANDECLLDLFRAVCGEYANKHITTGTVKEYLEISERYSLSTLRTFCTEFIERDINTANFHVYIEMAQEHNWTEIYEHCVKSAINKVGPSNWVHYVELANRYSLDELRNKCMDVMIKC